MRAFRFTIGAVLIVLSVLQLFGVAAVGLALALGEMTDTTYALGRVAVHVVLAIACGWGASRALRLRPVATPSRP